MDGFESKKALLNYLGKNPDDRKLIDRMISDGRVYKENGMLYLTPKGERGAESLDGSDRVMEGDNKIRKELEDYKKWFNEANHAYEELGLEHSKELKLIIDNCFYWMQNHKCLPVQTRKEFNYWARGIDTKDIQLSIDEVKDLNDLNGVNDIDLPF